MVAWNGHPVVASDGQPYESIASTEPGPTQFRLMTGAPRAGTWGLATVGPALLAANGEGVFVRDPEGRFTPVLAGLHAARLVALDATTCLAIGEEEIAALRLENGIWSECTPRIPGAGYPSIVHAGNRSAWVEYGVNHAARLTIEGDRLVRRSFEQFPWSQPQWVHVSVIGTTVAIIGAGNDALFFDESSETMVEARDLRELLAAAPYPIQRLCRDGSGTYWASHEHGLVEITTSNGLRQVDATSFANLNERTPLVRALPGGEIWICTGHSLYVLDSARRALPPPQVQPVLVSLLDSRTRAVIDRPAGARGELGVLPYRQNALTLGFFAGSYASMRPLGYDYRLNQGTWTPATTGSSISLSDLPEGDYHLAVRARDNRGPVASPAEFRFAVAPPWYRRWYAYASYPLLAAVVLAGLFRLLVRRAEARNAALERLVAQRTGELQATMLKLQQETRTSATLAERNRLAGEIHDSLEQCFTGLSLQLETTANFASCPPEVGAGLAVALNMVGYGRNEVRH
ncbi:MAG: sensor histidine kinase, partial [Opitutaceae bacterium]|nr:sensor histidine kinase [Opitutaceae bacterium]